MPPPDSTTRRACAQCQAEGIEASNICPHSLVFGADPLLQTTVANRYKVSSVIGMGGWSTVYRAHDNSLNRAVAIKILHPHLCIDQANTDRFRRESEAMAKLNHRNLAVIYDCGQLAEGRPYFVMELIEGVPLSVMIQQAGRLQNLECVTIFSQISMALDAIHKAGLIHRDLKPTNVLIDQFGTVKVLDFGLAKWILQENPLTKSDEVLGTPAYMSPEQCAGQKLDHRADIYSMGCMLYESLSGLKPFVSDNSLECMQMQINDPPPRLPAARRDLKLPSALEAVLMRSLAKDPADRYESAAAFRAALEKSLKRPSLSESFLIALALTGIGVRQRRQAFWLTGIFLICAIVSAAMLAEIFKQRTIQFPGGRAVGVVYLIENDASGGLNEKRQYAPARGQVKVPLKATVELDQIPARETARLGFLSDIRPDDLQKIDLYNTPVGSEAVVAINRLSGLETVSFRGCSIDDQALSSMNMPKLVGIDLSDTKISDQSAMQISKRETALRWIDLRNDTNITDAGISALATMAHMSCMKLENLAQITDACTEAISRSRTLTILILSGSNLSDTGVKSLSRMSQLTRLELNGTKIGDDAVADLTKISRLTRLDLSNTNITDKSIDALARIKHLRSLFISSTKVSADGLRLLRKALPECEITAN